MTVNRSTSTASAGQYSYRGQCHRTASAARTAREGLRAGLLPFPVTLCLEDDLTVLVVVVVSIFFTVGFGSFLFSGWVFLSLSISENMKGNVRLITHFLNSASSSVHCCTLITLSN